MSTTTACPNCKRTFNCDGPPDCWCLKVERSFDWEDFIIRTGMSSCVCPVCLTGKNGETTTPTKDADKALRRPRRRGRGDRP